MFVTMGGVRRPAGVAVALLLILAAAGAAQEPGVSKAREPASPAGGAATLTLSEAVGLALQRNRDLAGARLGLESAQAQVQEAWGSVMPRVDLTTSYTRSLSVPATFLPKVFIDPTADPDELIAVKFGADNSWNLQIHAEQPLFQATAFIGVGAASRYNALQEESVRGQAQQVATSVRLAYYDVLLAEEALRLNDNSVRRIRQTLEETRARQRAGFASEYEVLRLEVELANIEPNLRRARTQLAAAKRGLAVALGMDAVDSLKLEGSLAAVDVRPVALEREAKGDVAPPAGADLLLLGAGAIDAARLDEARAVEVALDHRSDLRQLELTELLRKAELRAEQSEYLPKVSLFGTYTINAQQNGDPDFFADNRQRAYGRQVGVQVTMPLFNGFKRPARLEQKESVLQQVRVQTSQVAAQAENEVRTLLARVEEAGERAEAQRLAVEQARRGFQIASAQYREGLSSQLEVTDAEIALRQSEFNHAQAVYDYLAARAQFDAAVGIVPLVDTDAGAGPSARVRLSLERNAR